MSTVTLILMRHAKSDWHTADHDFDRPLSERGIRDARRMGKWLSSSAYMPEKMIASPAVRARQTVELLCQTANMDSDRTIWQKSIYQADPDTLIALARQHFETAKTIMLVGHNPTIATLLHHLSADDIDTTETGKYVTTANIAVLELDKSSELFLQAGSARLLAMVRPKQLDG